MSSSFSSKRVSRHRCHIVQPSLETLDFTLMDYDTLVTRSLVSLVISKRKYYLKSILRCATKVVMHEVMSNEIRFSDKGSLPIKLSSMADSAELSH